jgi:hypothetical protein
MLLTFPNVLTLPHFQSPSPTDVHIIIIIIIKFFKAANLFEVLT